MMPVVKFLAALFVFMPLLSKAQSTEAAELLITGKLSDSSTKKPVVYATINLLDTSRNILASTYSDEKGLFKLLSAKAGVELEISSMGYATRLYTINRLNRQPLDLAEILLTPTGQQLSGVTVVGRKRLIEQKPGVLVYNAGNDPGNKGGTAADVLRKAPVLSVDAQGNVSMRGSSSIKILINGKYSGQMARSPSDALNMIPAEIIQSVEIVTTPSVKYDAEGTAGVINIITKKGRKDFTGALEFSGSNMQQMMNPRLEFTSGKWNLSFHGHLHRLRIKESAVYERQQLENGIAGNRLNQEIKQDNSAPHGSADVTIVFNPDSLSEWSLGINSSIGNWPGNQQVSTRSFRSDNTLEEFYQQQVKSAEQYLSTDINLAYNRKFRKAGQELTVQAQWSPGNSSQPYTSQLTDAGNRIFYQEDNSNRIRNNEWTLQLDYVHPLNSIFTAETGAKAIRRNANNRYTVSANEGGTWSIIDERTDRFRNKQEVWAAYGLLKSTITKKWYTEAGIRWESTLMRGELETARQAFGQQFGNLVPTATVTHKLNSDQTLTLSYTKRITRPFIFDMNPNINAADPKNLETGNPSLSPEITHQLEFVHGLNLGAAFFMNSAIYWRNTEDGIVDFRRTDENGISTSRKENLAGNKSYGLNFSATSLPMPWWSINSNVNINYLSFKSDALQIVRDGWAADLDLNTAFKLPRKYSLQLAGTLNTRKIELQGASSKQYYYSSAIKKEWATPKLVLTLLAVNPFNSYIPQEIEMRTPQFYSYSRNRYYLREFKLTLNWEFGARMNSRERKKISNDDVNSGNKG